MLKTAFLTIAVALFAGLLAGPVALVAALVGAAGLAGLWFYGRSAHVHVPELTVGVIVDRRRQAFSRFLPAGRHWLQPFVEEVTAVIDLTVDAAADTCHAVQTSSGIAVDIAWKLSFTLNPFRIPADKQAKLSRSLPRKAAIMPRKHVNHCLRILVGELALEELWQPGTQRRLERQLRQMAGERLAGAGYELSRVMIDEIEVPAPVRVTLEAAQRRRLQAENEAQALARLQQAVSQFSERDMERLLELERIQALGKHGVALAYTMPGMMPAQPPKREVMPDPTLWPPHRVTINQPS